MLNLFLSIFVTLIDINIDLGMCKKQTTLVDFSELLLFVYLHSLRYSAECRHK